MGAARGTSKKNNVTRLPTARSPRGSSPIPENIGHLAAQAELDALIFPHYLLGRQLALEETVRELLLATPVEERAELVDKLRFNADQAMRRLQDGIADSKDEAATCGYVCTLLQQGM